MKQSILSLMILLTFLACSSNRPDGKTEAEVLYKEAQTLTTDGHYLQATEYLNQIRSQYPYSFYATHAELLLADILFKQESYIEASAAYILFRDFHPKHKDIPYVSFKIAESYFKQIPSTFDRDLSPAVEAIKYYKILLSKYADSEYSKNAKERIVECEELLTNKEKYIADFYFKTESYASARYRYLEILNGLENVALREHAMIRILASSLYLDKKEECLSYFNKFNSQISDANKNELSSVAEKCRKP